MCNYIYRVLFSADTNITDMIPSDPEFLNFNGVKYDKNELFVDVVEQYHMEISRCGVVKSVEIRGSIQCDCRLSGWPYVKIRLNTVPPSDEADDDVSNAAVSATSGVTEDTRQGSQETHETSTSTGNNHTNNNKHLV